jgi:hypothetical protein
VSDHRPVQESDQPPLETRPQCLGCGKQLVRHREAHVWIGGRRDGSLLVSIDVEPLLSRATDIEELMRADDLYLLGFAHRDCGDLAARRLAAREVELPDDLVRLRAETDESELPALHLPPPLDRCPFCNGDTETDEHVFPNWISKLLSARGGLVDKSSPYGPRRLRKIDRTTPSCASCNHEWLSVLENDTSQILAPMVRGEGRRLEPAEQKLLATWALKTAMMLDLTSGNPTVPAGFFHMLRQRREPFESAIVDIGAYIDSTWAAWAQPRALHIAVDTAERPNGVVVTILVGRVIFQVVAHFARGEMSIDDDRIYKDALARIWPPSPNVLEWPPAGLAFGDKWLTLLAEGIRAGQ